MPRLTGRYAMLDQLVAEGVKYVFGNPGTTEQAFMDALQDKFLQPHLYNHFLCQDYSLLISFRLICLP